MNAEMSANTAHVAKAFVDAMESSRFVDAFSLVAEDGRYIVIGTTPVSGIYNGKQDVLDKLLPVLSGFNEPPTLKFSEMIVSGDRAVLLATGAGEGPTGPYRQPYYAFVTRVKGDGFAEIVEFLDTQMLVSALFG